jgi:amidohydrolase
MAKTITAEIKVKIKAAVDSQRQQLLNLSNRIHANPELGFKEEKASGWLSDYLGENGFSIAKGILGMPTAFKASYGSGQPKIAFLAEYDALPQLGHACGHNIIAAAAIGAAYGAKQAVDNYGGSIIVFGTPAEELYGGKIVMARQGAFDDIDAAVMVHPSTLDSVTITTLACAFLEIEFFGRQAHAAAEPEAGINALDAMLISFTAINSLRQHIRDEARVHGIITDGGQSANIVPGYSAAALLVRSEDENYLEELKGKVLNCFRGGAKASGARLKYRWGETTYLPMRSNMALARLFMDNMVSTGWQMKLHQPNRYFGSTDMGNLSQLLPAIHPLVAIAPPEVAVHSPEFAQAAISEVGQRAIINAAKALAMTAADLLANPQALRAVKEEFSA